MKNNPKITLARQHPSLLVYVLLNLALTLVTLAVAIKVTHEDYTKYLSTNGSSAATPNVLYTIIGIIWGIQLLIYVYLLISKNINKVRLILKILLALYVIGILFSHSLIGVAMDVIEACLTFTVLRYLGNQYKNVLL